MLWKIEIPSTRLREIADIVTNPDHPALVDMAIRPHLRVRPIVEKALRELPSGLLRFTLEAREIPRFDGEKITSTVRWGMIRHEVNGWIDDDRALINATILHEIALLEDRNFYPNVPMLALGSQDVAHYRGHPIVPQLSLSKKGRQLERKLGVLFPHHYSGIKPDSHVLLLRRD